MVMTSRVCGLNVGAEWRKDLRHLGRNSAPGRHLAPLDAQPWTNVLHKTTDYGTLPRSSPPPSRGSFAQYSPQAPRLFDQARDRIPVKHYSIRTEQSYLDWVLCHICFHGLPHPSGTQAEAAEKCLADVALGVNVAPSTQDQAKSALMFLHNATPNQLRACCTVPNPHYHRPHDSAPLDLVPLYPLPWLT